MPLSANSAEWSVLRLASRFESLSSLQSAAIHEFRGSLNTMSLGVLLLEQMLANPSSSDMDAQRRCLRSLGDELKRLEQLTGAVLEAGRPDHTDTPVRVSLADVAADVARLIRPTAERQRVSLEVLTPRDLVEVAGRRTWLRQAVLNLARNALDAMDGGGELRLEVTATPTHAALVVSDTGPGVDPAIAARIWEIYFSTRQGLGIGLPVASWIVEAHDGTLALEPSDRGARFLIRLPLTQ
jgi:signal transduction histidine kinase